MTEESRDGEILIEVKGMKKWFPIKGGMFSGVKTYVRAVVGLTCKSSEAKRWGSSASRVAARLRWAGFC